MTFIFNANESLFWILHFSSLDPPVPLHAVPFLCNTVHFCYLISFYQCLNVISAVKSSLASTSINIQSWRFPCMDNAELAYLYVCMCVYSIASDGNKAATIFYKSDRAFVYKLLYIQFCFANNPKKLDKEFSTTFRIKLFYGKIMHSTQW